MFTHLKKFLKYDVVAHKRSIVRTKGCRSILSLSKNASLFLLTLLVDGVYVGVVGALDIAHHPARSEFGRIKLAKCHAALVVPESNLAKIGARYEYLGSLGVLDDVDVVWLRLAERVCCKPVADDSPLLFLTGLEVNEGLIDWYTFGMHCLLLLDLEGEIVAGRLLFLLDLAASTHASVE